MHLQAPYQQQPYKNCLPDYECQERVENNVL